MDFMIGSWPVLVAVKHSKIMILSVCFAIAVRPFFFPGVPCFVNCKHALYSGIKTFCPNNITGQGSVFFIHSSIGFFSFSQRSNMSHLHPYIFPINQCIIFLIVQTCTFISTVAGPCYSYGVISGVFGDFFKDFAAHSSEELFLNGQALGLVHSCFKYPLLKTISN